MTAQPQGYRSPYSPEGFDKTRGDTHSDDVAFEEAERGSPTRLDVELDLQQFPSLDAARASTPKRHLRAVPDPRHDAAGDACDTDDESSNPGSGGGGWVTHTVVSVSTTKNAGAWAKPPPLVRAPELSDRAPPPAADVTTPTPTDDAVDRWPKPAVASRGSLASPGGTREKSAGNEEAAADPPPDTPAATPTNHPPAPRAKPPAPKEDQPSPSPAPERASSSHRRSRGGSRRKRRDVSPTVPASPPADAAVTPATATPTPPEKKTNDNDGGKERPGPAGPNHAGSDSDDAIDHPATPEAVLVAKAEVAIVDGKSSPVKVVDVSVSTTVSAPTTAGDDVSREDPSTIATVDESTTREEDEEAEEELMGAEGAEGVPRSPVKPLDASFEFGDPAASPAGPTPENLSGGTVTAVAVEAAAELAAAEAKAAIVPSTALVPDASAGTFRGAGESLAVAPPSPKHGITITPFDAERQQREIYVPNVKVGLVIGKGGSHVVYFQHQSGAAIHIARDQGEIPGGVNYVVPPCAYADQCESAVTGDGEFIFIIVWAISITDVVFCEQACGGSRSWAASTRR